MTPKPQMTKLEILKRAIEKVIGNDWHTELKKWVIHDSSARDHLVLCVPNFENKTKLHISDYDIIFSHDFAKAFFGEKYNGHCMLDISNSNHIHDEKCRFNRGWQYHLQQMILEKDPIKYLEQFL